MKTPCWLSGLLLAVTLCSTSQAQLISAASGDWPWWRGPNFNGIAESGQSPAISWSESENIVWKSPIPGRGHSTPAVVGNRVVLTTADERSQVQSILCFDRTSGRPLWKFDANQGRFPESIHRKNTHASGSVACDGRLIIATFYNNQRIQVVAVDLDGKPIWQRSAGGFAPDRYKYGYAPSPTLYGNLVIVAADFDGNAYLVALERSTGQEVWRTPRPGMINYASPVVAEVAGRHQLLISGCEIVASYDPLTGRQLWQTAATTMATVGTMIWQGDLVFASGGYPNAGTFGIRGDGSGQVLWRNNQKCYEQSMLVADGFVYAVTDPGIAFCWDAQSGQERWRQRLRGPISASPTLAGGTIYVSNEAGTTWVYRASPQKFELVSQNQLGNEAFASPVICGNQIFLRVAHGSGGGRQEMLYCIGN